jgi:TPR repeat protein
MRISVAARAYFLGIGAEPDYVKAARFFKAAADESRQR